MNYPTSIKQPLPTYPISHQITYPTHTRKLFMANTTAYESCLSHSSYLSRNSWAPQNLSWLKINTLDEYNGQLYFLYHFLHSNSLFWFKNTYCTCWRCTPFFKQNFSCISVIHHITWTSIQLVILLCMRNVPEMVQNN